MINSLCGSMGSVKTESSSCSKPQPPSPTDSVSESNNVAAADFDRTDQNDQNPLSTFQDLKFDVDVEVQSPDNSIWESLFTDQLDVGAADFMISSPRRDFMVCSPKRELMICSPKREFMAVSPKRTLLSQSGYNHSNYSYGQSMHGQRCTQQQLVGCCGSNSCNWAPMGPVSNTHKGKPQSPLHRLSNTTQFVQPDSLPLPAMDGFMDDYFRECYGGYPNPTVKMVGAGCGPESLDTSTVALPGMFDCLPPMSSRFCGSMSDASGLTQESDVYQMSSFVTAPQPQQPPSQQQQTVQQPPQQQLQENLEQEQDSGLQLVHLLLACAEAVAKDDYLSARRFLHHLNRVVTPLGDSMQRVASCFTDALTARLTATLTTSPNSSTPKSFTSLAPNSVEVLKVYQILYQACPYVKFAHFTANQAIFEAFEAEDRVHVIDLDILQGYQWPAFMQALAARPSGAPFLRITGVGSTLESVRETGRRLTELAHSLHVPFEFHPIGERLEDLQPHMFHRRVGEALAVNSVCRLHHVSGNHLGNLIAMIRDQAPNIFTLVEQEASHNGPYFLGRFLEALHYYSAIFDSLDATFPADSPERAKVEQYIFAAEIRNIVACEGAERHERHERLEKWRKIMEGKRFKGVALSANAVTQSKILLGLYPCDGYRLTEDRGCLLLGWQDRAIIAASAWRC
ncbi:hypothetical protein MRB53_027456 [Persea americana]|uniref:Uncharacterized protein n=1 Tax=Persea americana TaxID=3435 RepID=A0ACC2LL70_PERAE|nr:hypothetical protein MRB53_027456 [Persea americana]